MMWALINAKIMWDKDSAKPKTEKRAHFIEILSSRDSNCHTSGVKTLTNGTHNRSTEGGLKNSQSLARN